MGYTVIDRAERAAHQAAAVAVGNFDGVHRGHAAMLELLVRHATPLGLHTRAVTFDPHPGVVLGRGSPPLLTTLDRRADLVRALGIEALAVCPFDAELATWSPERFVRDLLVGALGARLVVVGENFRFGAQRAGDYGLLQALGAELGFDTVPAPLAGDDRGPFSSSRARDAIRAGDMAEATRVLGRPHAFTGTVVRGDQRGRTIGFPTANLAEILEMVPPRGVYAVEVEGLGASQVRDPPSGENKVETIGRGVMNIGVRPTVSGESETREVHVLDWTGDLYGRRIAVHVLERIRDEKKFGSLDELKAQIEKDVSAARAGNYRT